MLKTWQQKPYRPFFILAVISLVVALVYRLFSPATYFDISIREYYALNIFHVWLIFSTYVFLLSGIYYIIARKNLHSRTWLLRSHYIFIVLFLFFFFLFSLFNTVPVQELTSGISFYVLFGIYGMLFILDVALFIGGLLFLLVNIISLKRD
jgi:hypothetical protein